jgi:hypothetical protein
MQHLPGGETWRFTTPGAFLDHIQAAAGNIHGLQIDAGDPAPDQGLLPDPVVQKEREEG